MEFYHYILILASVPLYAGFGSALFGFSSFNSSLLSGLLMAATIGEVILRFCPIAFRYAYLLWVLIGFLWIVRNFSSIYSSCRYLLARNFHRLVIVFFLMSVLLSCFHYKFFLFESHSVLYFDAAIEGFRADYLGNVRVSSAFPLERAALHLTPATFVAALNVFNKNPNLINLIEARYLLCVMFMALFVSGVLREAALRDLFFWALLSIGVFGIYGNYLSYYWSISSFCYVFVLMRLVLLCCEEGKYDSIEFCAFSIFLLVCKSTILPLSGCFSVWVITQFIKKHSFRALLRSRPFILSCVCVIACLFSWQKTPQGMEKLSTIGLVLPHSVSDFQGLEPLDDPFKSLVRSRTGLVLVYGVVLLVFGPLLMLIRRKKNEGRVWMVWAFIAIAGLLFFRIDGNLKHIRHLHYFGACLVALLLLAEKKPANNKLWVVSVFLVGVLMWSFTPQKLWQIPFYHLDLRTNFLTDYHFYSFEEFSAVKNKIMVDEAGFYIPRSGEPYWQTELNSAMLGKRVKLSSVVPDYGENMKWFLPSNSY